MNERKLRLLLNRIALLAAPLPISLTVGCGGEAVSYEPENGGGAAGSSGGSAGSSAGSGGQGGSGGSVGTGGSIAQGGTVSSGGAGGFSGGAGAGGSGGGASCQGSSSPSCLDYYEVELDRACIPLGTTGELPAAQCAEFCNTSPSCPCGGVEVPCYVSGGTMSTVIVTCTPGCFVGRKPTGYADPDNPGLDLGAHFARAAEVEALAVIAFKNLREELAELGAPRTLLRALSSAARDEVRHARSTARLARRFGGVAAWPRAVRRTPRSLEAIAIENAVEGCVREVYGALSAVWQARAAQDPAVRSAMRKIARDEIRHAALSLKVQRWLEPRLDAASRRRVAQARRRAIRELERELAVEPPPDTVRLAGHPSAAQARRLFGALEERVLGA